MASNKVIITCAVTGAIHTPSMSPYLPVTADQIAAAVAYLLSPAGRNLSGLSMNVDGNLESL